MSSSVAAVVLAAGAGTRFGMPKGLARSGGQLWLVTAVQRIREAGITPITVVLGAAAVEIRAAARDEIADESVRWVIHQDWQTGRTGSIQRGVRDLPAAATGVLIHPVDHPHVASATIRALVAAHAAAREGKNHIFVPVADGHRGHPILIGRAIWPEILQLGADEPLRTIVHRRPARVTEVAVEDPGIHRDINEPADGEEP